MHFFVLCEDKKEHRALAASPLQTVLAMGPFALLGGGLHGSESPPGEGIGDETPSVRGPPGS